MNKSQDIHPEMLRILMEKNAMLEKELAHKNADLLTKQTVITKLNSDLDAANFQLEQMRRLIFGSKRERFVPAVNTLQMMLDFEPETIEIAKEVEQEKKKIKISYQRSKPVKKHRGRLEFPAHLPVVETIIEPEEDTTNMICIGRDETKELDYTAAKLQVNVIIRPKYISKEEDQQGNHKYAIAELKRPIPKCIASVNLLAMIFVNKFVFHLPLYRILQQISKMGMKLPSSTLDSWVKLGSELLKPLYVVHRLYVFREIYQMIDESPIKVQDGKIKGACHRGYMWVRYAPLSQSTLFEYYPGRSTKGPMDDLKTFTGFIQTDGYSGYTYLAQKEGITHLSCWVHARRYFDKALGNDHDRASHILRLIQVLYSVESLARESNMSSGERYTLRLEKSLPVINEIGQYIYREKSKVLPQSPIGKAFNYCSNRWISLQNYLKDGMLEIDSNLVENSIRPLAVGRKNYLFAGSHEGAKNIAMYYSFFSTCKKHDINPEKWLSYVMKNINDTKSSQLKHLLPQFIDKNLLT